MRWWDFAMVVYVLDVGVGLVGGEMVAVEELR